MSMISRWIQIYFEDGKKNLYNEKTEKAIEDYTHAISLLDREVDSDFKRGLYFERGIACLIERNLNQAKFDFGMAFSGDLKYRRKLGWLYVINCLINGGKYYGITWQIPREKRVGEHKREAEFGKRTSWIYEAIREYGWNNFEVEWLLDEIFITRESLKTIENQIIIITKTINSSICYNMDQI